GEDGSIYFLSQTGGPKLLAQVPASVGGIAGTYASTPNGIYDVSQTPAKLVLNSNDSAIYSTGVSIFAARNDGSVDHFIGGVQKITNSNLPAPNPGVVVSQFAYPDQGPHDPDKGIYVLAAGQVFYRKDSLIWLRVNQTILPPAQLLPGALTLLTADTTWIAGYLESSYKGSQKGYGYRAKSEGIYPQVHINSTTYTNDVLIVSYTTESNGVMDSQNVPQYTIYFEKGVGPVAFERTWNGTTVTTQLIQ
ncbi:MAG TPA: hypothetical protein VFD13_00655, partial [Candidatus Kapabacteria bacterium]|nr:hypothetical protein [Candidatus Kapabacteria bacterium]